MHARYPLKVYLTFSAIKKFEIYLTSDPPGYVSWPEAQLECQKKLGTLAVLTSTDESIDIVKLVDNWRSSKQSNNLDLRLFIGLYREK